MRFIILFTVLAFPIAEILLLIKLFNLYGVWVLLYLVAIACLGLQLIREEKLLFSGRMMNSLMQNGNPIKALLGSARNMIAGILLIIPGVITDIIAVILLLLPVKSLNKTSTNPHYQNPQAANDDVIEGEFKRED